MRNARTCVLGGGGQAACWWGSSWDTILFAVALSLATSATFWGGGVPGVCNVAEGECGGGGCSALGLALTGHARNGETVVHMHSQQQKP
jgi:hypothetical protein